MLASIQRINKVFPIEGADRIEGAEVLGWKCVVRKGIFKEDDLCIYIEIDTIIPKYLLDESYEGDEKIRLRTVKMKGQISQGLVLPIDTISVLKLNDVVWERIKARKDFFSAVGLDVTDLLGVEKYEKPIPANMAGIIKGDFPAFLRKTDEVRIQSEPNLLEKLKGKPFYITTKLDGTSATYYKFEGKFGVCSRNNELEFNENNLYWKMALKYNIESWLPDGYAVQGEICGEGIQKNPLRLKGQELFVFNIYNIKDGRNLSECDCAFFIEMNSSVSNNLSFVPYEDVSHHKGFNFSLDELLEKAKGNYSSGKRKEGIVVRSIDQTISFKVVNNDYLLKDEE